MLPTNVDEFVQECALRIPDDAGRALDFFAAAETDGAISAAERFPSGADHVLRVYRHYWPEIDDAGARATLWALSGEIQEAVYRASAKPADA